MLKLGSKISFLYVLLFFLFGKPCFAQQQIKYKNYLNQSYGFSVDYPYEILMPKGESISGDGQTFESKNGSGNLLAAYRDFLDNMDPEVNFTLEIGFKKEVRACEGEGARRKLTYKKLGKDFYILSGYTQNGNIFYQKSILVQGSLCTCILEYRKEDKTLFNKISERVFSTFK